VCSSDLNKAASTVSTHILLLRFQIARDSFPVKR